MDKKIIKLIAIVAVIIIACVIIFGGRSAKKAAKQYIDGMLSGDAKQAYEVLCKDSKKAVGETKKIAINKMEKALENQQDTYRDKYGNNWKYKVKVIDAYEYKPEDGEYAGEDLMKVVVQVTHKGSKWLSSKEGEETITVLLIKEGRKWCVIK